jgi:ankyrin repeat protein
MLGASFKGYADVVQALVDCGAARDAQHSNGGTALVFAAMFGRNDRVDLLLDKRADPA